MSDGAISYGAGFDLSFGSTIVKIYPFTNFCWLKKDENMYYNNFFQPRGQYIFHNYWKQIYVWDYSFSGPTSIYLFKFSSNNSRIKCKMCSKLTIEEPYIILVFLLLALNIVDIILISFCWLWTFKYQIE